MSSTSDKTLICKFWLSGSCRRSQCRYAHSEAEKAAACKALPCQFHASGYCRLGSECLYRHSGPTPDDTEAACEDLKTVSSAASETGYLPEVESNASQPDESSADDDQTHSESPSTVPSRTSGQQDLQQGKYDKTQSCKFWLEGRCQRGQWCKYAHGEEEQRRACSTILCRFVRRGGKCTAGDACWYSHSVQDAGAMAEAEKRIKNNDASRSGMRERSLTAFSATSTAAPSSASSQDESETCNRTAADKTLFCTFWQRGRCDKGESCRYAHSAEEKRKACSTIRCQFQVNGRCRLGSNCLYLHEGDRALADKSTSRPSENHSSVDCKEEARPAREFGKFNKTQLCKFWQKSKCEKGENCHFAHGEEEQREACGKITCRWLLQNGSCHLGSDCWFAHSTDAKIVAEPATLPPSSMWSPSTCATASPPGVTRLKVGGFRRYSWADVEDTDDEDDELLAFDLDN
eukprot:TRINITY_DN38093_c0_g1_i1.p1 TRINITY_DN38093_c0_g1~~TRINITY_DN38093_c0_g1_i1.p1  ORF type:complete len:461 (+),score=80.77 TRINITY_DN38093_c0_g1_i1:79-1461(+)